MSPRVGARIIEINRTKRNLQDTLLHFKTSFAAQFYQLFLGKGLSSLQLTSHKNKSIEVKGVSLP